MYKFVAKSSLSRLRDKKGSKMVNDILTKTFIGMRAKLLASARRLLANDDEADDALQDAFYKLWQRRGNIESEREAAGISTVTVKNVCIDMLRKRQAARIVNVEVADECLDDGVEQEQDELYGYVKDIINQRLGDRERKVLMMRDSMEMEFDDIAAELCISEANARLILSRARKTVREIYLSQNIKR